MGTAFPPSRPPVVGTCSHHGGHISKSVRFHFAHINRDFPAWWAHVPTVFPRNLFFSTFPPEGSAGAGGREEGEVAPGEAESAASGEGEDEGMPSVALE